MTPQARNQFLYAIKQVCDGAQTIAAILLDDYCDREESARPRRSQEASRESKIEPLLTVKEAAAMLQISVRILYEWDAQGKIPTRRVGGELRFLREELLAWTEKEAKEARERARAPRRRSKLRIAGGGVIN